MAFLPLIERAATADRKGVTRIQSQFLEKLMPTSAGYWIDYSNFGKGVPQRGAALIGQAHTSIIINILLPTMLVWAEHSQSPQLGEAVQRLYDSYPKLQKNYITEQIEAQIFSKQQPMKLISPSAKKQQGAIYLHKNFCSSQLCDLRPIIQGGGVDGDTENTRGQG